MGNFNAFGLAKSANSQATNDSLALCYGLNGKLWKYNFFESLSSTQEEEENISITKNEKLARNQTKTRTKCLIGLSVLQMLIGSSIVGSGVAYNIIFPDLGYWWCFYSGGLVISAGIIGIITRMKRSNKYLDGSHIALNTVSIFDAIATGGNIMRTLNLYPDWLKYMHLRELYLVMSVQFAIRLLVTILVVILIRKR